MHPTLELRNVTKRHKHFTLDKVSFTLPQGYIMGLIGPNGSGKSTIIRLIMNLTRRDDGEVSVLGMDNRRTEARDMIGFVYDRSLFHSFHTPLDIERTIAPFYSQWDAREYRRYLKAFSLPLRTRVGSFSQGMLMKTHLAVALSHHARLIIMDEPTSGLDPLFRREFYDILADCLEADISVLLSTHLTTHLERVADYITFLHEGTVVFSQQTDKVLEDYAVLRGLREQFSHAMAEQFIGVSLGSMYFEGLVRTDHPSFAELATEYEAESPSLEEIMRFTVNRGA